MNSIDMFDSTKPITVGQLKEALKKFPDNMFIFGAAEQIYTEEEMDEIYLDHKNNLSLNFEVTIGD